MLNVHGRSWDVGLVAERRRNIVQRVDEIDTTVTDDVTVKLHDTLHLTRGVAGVDERAVDSRESSTARPVRSTAEIDRIGGGLGNESVGWDRNHQSRSGPIKGDKVPDLRRVGGRVRR